LGRPTAPWFPVSVFVLLLCFSITLASFLLFFSPPLLYSLLSLRLSRPLFDPFFFIALYLNSHQPGVIASVGLVVSTLCFYISFRNVT